MTPQKGRSKAKSGDGSKRSKAKVKRELKDLDVRKAKEVRGGEATITHRKAGKLQH